MNLFEFFSTAPEGYQTEKDDQSVLHQKNTRKTRLTLGHINRLRIMNDIRRIEYEKDVENVTKQYGAAPAEGGAPGGLL